MLEVICCLLKLQILLMSFCVVYSLDLKTCMRTLFLAGHIFDHKNWPGFGGGEALMLYGKDEIKTITEYLRMPNVTWI